MIKVGDLVEIEPVRQRSKFQQAEYKRYLKKVGIVIPAQGADRIGRGHRVYFPELKLSEWFVRDIIRSLCEEK